MLEVWRKKKGTNEIGKEGANEKRNKSSKERSAVNQLAGVKKVSDVG